MGSNIRAALFVVGTPIGNLQDLSPRAKEILSSVDLIAAEDTRHTRGLLSSIGAETRLISYHEHNEAQRAPELVAKLLAGASVALVTDAGMPLVSDPGERLVREAREAGIDVVSIPGPSAVTAALSIAGLPAARFVFEGFLPRRGAARSKRLHDLRAEERTIVLYESVHRLQETLHDLRAELGPQRCAVLVRELTKLYESVHAGNLQQLCEALESGAIPLKGEFVIVVAGGRMTALESQALRVFELLDKELGAAKALKLAAQITGVSRNVLYRLTRAR